MTPNKTTAVGQYLGYAIQVWRALYRLLGAKPGDSVSLEVLDDVALQNKDGVLAEQDKSSISGANPISNKSSDLWKTLANWADLIVDGVLVPDTTQFVIYTRIENSGVVVNLLNDVKNISETDAVFLQIVDLLKDKTTGVIPTSISKYFDKFEGLTKEQRGYLMLNFSYEHGVGSQNEEVKTLLVSNPVVPDELADHIVIYLLGWVKKTLDGRIENDEAPIIIFDEFSLELLSLVRRLDRSMILASLIAKPTIGELGDFSGDVFVRQLELVNVDQDYIERAALSKRRAEDNIVAWTEKGLVHESSYDDLKDELLGVWGNEKSNVTIVHSNKTAQDKGRLVLNRCVAHKTKLQGHELESYFVPGSFHVLAENQVVGWHPDYKVKIKGGNSE